MASKVTILVHGYHPTIHTDLDELIGKKLAIAYWNRSEKDGSVVLRFHPGTVKRVTNMTNTGCTAVTKWDEVAEDSEEKLEETT